MNTAVSMPTAPVSSIALPSARPAVRVAAPRRSFVKALRPHASLLTTLALLGSCGAYCVYALASIAR